MSFRSGKNINGRRYVSMVVSADERGVVLKASHAKEHGLDIFISASLLAFEALDREDQVSLVLSHGERKAVKGLPSWSIPVSKEIFDRVNAWSFPLFNRTQIVRAASLAFIELPTEEQAEWIREVFIFIGDPRQSPGRIPLEPQEGTAQ